MPKFHLIFWCKLFWKGTVCTMFRENHPKLCKNCAFPQNFYTIKLSTIKVFYKVIFLETRCSESSLAVSSYFDAKSLQVKLTLEKSS